MQPVRSTECCSKRAEIPRPKQFKSPGSISKLSGLPILLDLCVPIFPIYAIFTLGVGQSTAADLDNQQDWATNVPLPSSASATREQELLIIASVATITTVMAILPNSAITVVRISVYHQPQVWLPLLKSEPYFLNCPWFLLAGVIPPNLISNCSSQPSIVHWLSSSIFPCLFVCLSVSPSVRPSRYGNIRPNLHFFQYTLA